jgi:DNA helicase HerA-like ATPase
MTTGPRIVAVVGKSGTGKTTLAGAMARASSRRLVVIVSTYQDPAYLQFLDSRKTRSLAIYSGARHLTGDDIADTLRSGYRYLFIAIYDLGPDEARDWIDALIPALEAVGNLAMFIDEAHRFCRHEYVPPRILQLGRWARSIGIDIVFVTHRLTDLSPDIRSVLTYLVMFQTDEPRDVAELSLRLGIPRDDGARLLRDLTDWQHVVYDLQRGRHSRPQTLRIGPTSIPPPGRRSH